MGEVIVIIAAVLIFILLWYAIGLVAAALAKGNPAPPFAGVLPLILYLLLILAAVWWLWTRYLGG